MIFILKYFTCLWALLVWCACVCACVCMIVSCVVCQVHHIQLIPWFYYHELINW